MSRRSLPAAVLVWALLSCALAGSTQVLAIAAGDARTTSFKLQSEGMRLYKEGKYKDAIEAFQQVVNINLNSFLAYYYLGLSLSADRRYGEAMEPLKIALDLQPDYVQAHLALGDACLKQGDTSEARAEYLRALELQPGYAAAFDGLGRLFEVMGQDDEAEKQYRKTLEINVAFADAYTHLGDLYLRRDRPEDAIDLFRKAISVKPDFGAAFTRLGVAYAREMMYDDAIAAIRKAQNLSPQDPDPFISLARIYLDLQSFKRAEAEIQAALAQDNDSPGAHLILSDLKRAQEDFDAAIEVLQGIYERGIQDTLMRRAVADALKRVKKDALRYTTLKTASEASAAGPQAHVELARFVSGQGSHKHAADLLLTAASLTDKAPPAPAPTPVPATVMGPTMPPPPSAMQLRFEAGLEFMAAHLFPQAVNLFRPLAGEAEPPASGSGAEGPAVTVPDSLKAAALFNLGVARASLRLDEQAARTFASYIEKYPNEARAYLYLGNANVRLGRKKDARDAYTAFLERASPGPDKPRVERLLRELDAPPSQGSAAVPSAP